MLLYYCCYSTLAATDTTLATLLLLLLILLCNCCYYDTALSVAAVAVLAVLLCNCYDCCSLLPPLPSAWHYHHHCLRCFCHRFHHCLCVYYCLADLYVPIFRRAHVPMTTVHVDNHCDHCGLFIIADMIMNTIVHLLRCISSIGLQSSCCFTRHSR